MRAVMCLSSEIWPQAPNSLKCLKGTRSTLVIIGYIIVGVTTIGVLARETRVPDDGRRWAVADELRAEVANPGNRSHCFIRDRSILNAVYASQRCGDGRVHSTS